MDFLGEVGHFEGSFLLDIHQLLVKQPAEDDQDRMMMAMLIMVMVDDDDDHNDDDLPAQCCSSTRASQLFTLQPTLPSTTFQDRNTEEPLDVAISWLAVMNCTFQIRTVKSRSLELEGEHLILLAAESRLAGASQGHVGFCQQAFLPAWQRLVGLPAG